MIPGSMNRLGEIDKSTRMTSVRTGGSITLQKAPVRQSVRNTLANARKYTTQKPSQYSVPMLTNEIGM